jgi:hypothetical protein
MGLLISALVLAVPCAWVILRALRRGELQITVNATLKRAERPVVFWLYLAFLAAVPLGLAALWAWQRA